MPARQTARKYNGYTAHTVAQLADATVRTIELWRDEGLITPSLARSQGRGSFDVYSFGDLLAVRAAHRLRKSGMPKDGVKRVISYLQQRNADAPASDTFIIIDGDTVMEKRGEELVGVFLQPGQPVCVLVISLEIVEQEVRQAIGA